MFSFNQILAVSVQVNSLPILICLRIDLLSDRSPTKLRVMASTLAAAAARRVAVLSSPRLSSQAASFAQRRGLSGAADHHGPPKVNCWQDPMNPSKWKEEHFVIVSLSGWGMLFFGGYKFFTGGKGKKEEKLVEASH